MQTLAGEGQCTVPITAQQSQQLARGWGLNFPSLDHWAADKVALWVGEVGGGGAVPGQGVHSPQPLREVGGL